MLVVREKRLLEGVRGDGDERCSDAFELGQDAVHGFELADAERAPASADEADNQAVFAEKFSGRDRLAVVIQKFKRGRLGADWQNSLDYALGLEFGDGAGVDGLNFRWHVLGDKFLAFSKDFAQGAGVRGGSRFFERAAFHKIVGRSR